jgi:hypothetical protein
MHKKPALQIQEQSTEEQVFKNNRKCSAVATSGSAVVTACSPLAIAGRLFRNNRNCSAVATSGSSVVTARSPIAIAGRYI